MSSTWNLPLVGGTDTVKTMYVKVNDGFESLRSLHSGAVAPASTVAFMLWLDTSTTPDSLKMRNAADSAWVTLLDDVTASGGGAMLRSAPAADANLDMDGDGGGPYEVVSLADGTADDSAATVGQINGALHQMVLDIGTLNATTTIHIMKGMGLDVVDVALITGVATALHATNYWAAQITNATAANNLLLNAKTTETAATNSEAITADAWWEFGADQNQGPLGADDVIDLVITKTGAPADLTNVKLVITYTTNA